MVRRLRESMKELGGGEGNCNGKYFLEDVGEKWGISGDLLRIYEMLVRRERGIGSCQRVSFQVLKFFYF